MLDNQWLAIQRKNKYKNKQKGYTIQSSQYKREYNILFKNGGERIIGEMEMGERKTHLYTLKSFLI